MAFAPLPGILVAWTAYAGADPYVQHTVYRREQRGLVDDHGTLTMEFSGARTLLPTEDVLNGIQGGVVVRIEITGALSGTPTYFDYRDDASNFLWLYYEVAGSRFRLERMVAGVSTVVSVSAAASLGSKFTLEATWTATGISLRVNAGTASTASTGSGQLAATLADIGTKAGASDGAADEQWVVAIAGTLTAADSTLLHAFGDTPPYLQALADLSASALPTALWDGAETTGQKVVLDAWTAIAVVTDQARPWYRDLRVESRKTYEYAVTVSANIFGAVLESEKQSPPAAKSETHQGIVLSDPDDPTWYAIVQGTAVRVTPRHETRYLLARGRRRETAHIGELESSRVAVTLARHTFNDREQWTALRKLFERLRDSTGVLLVRPGLGERYFVNLETLEREDTGALWTGTVELQETHYDEAAA